MKVQIGISNFSFNTPHFSSFTELTQQFLAFKAMREVCIQESVSFIVANDIREDKYFGLSIDEQIKNFEFGGDRGMNVAFRQRLYRDYLNGCDFTSHSSQEIKQKAKTELNSKSEEYPLLYVPKIPISGHRFFRNQIEFAEHYEIALSQFPIDENSYFTRAKSHFSNIIFHADCERTLSDIGDGGITNFSVTITKCLRALNSHQAEMKIPEDLNILGHLAECDCSTQGRNGKEDMKFLFPEISANEVNCEYHLKPHRSNDLKDDTYYHKRIYFTFAKIKGEIKTFVASIGPHL
ncbi:hypothetical protein ACSTDR_09030 [Vibrio vulnificus]|uniref:hypothetical protein n=1 Tax=Vibrio vulnificus TaxID=672 RepID=UPI003ED8456A